jgi:H+/Cl- antiporter ClcA
LQDPSRPPTGQPDPPTETGLLARLSRLLPARRRNLAYLRLWFGRLAFWLGAVGVGLLAVAFAKLADWFGHQFQLLYSEFPWIPWVLTPAGGVFLLWITRRYFPGAEGSGIPQTLAHLQAPQAERPHPLLSLKIIIGKIFVGASAVGAGFSLGREGPTVQVGASLMNELHKILPRSLHISREHLIVAGGAAGIAAAFNTPLAGIMFAIEEMTRSVSTRVSGLIIIAIVLAGVVSQALIGGGHYFGHILIAAETGDLLIWVIVASLASGVAGGLFARMLIKAALGWTGPIADFRKRRPLVFAGICGLLIAAMGSLTAGAIFGTGYEPTRALLEGDANDLPWYFFFFKLAATFVSYLSGLPGGIFAPSLSIGAGLGHALTYLLGNPEHAGMLLVLAMAGFLAAATQAPITSFIIVMEMVDGYSKVIALMAVALFASWISRLFCPPLYMTLARRYLPPEQPSPPPALPGPPAPASTEVADPASHSRDPQPPKP